MTEPASSSRRKPLLPNVVLALVLLVPVYVLSYAPVAAIMIQSAERHHGPRWPAIRVAIPVYAPVDWLIDHTLLAEPLFRWAELFGIGNDFRIRLHCA